ncbi:uncharacterized protein LOC142803513 [Rhipicephalus microplus]|uniref:uncharacterized protein LOC142803513 n=1 Tax=Rhipicephalus microplus TaxID=6941 RepID=UPI003F6CF392
MAYGRTGVPGGAATTTEKRRGRRPLPALLPPLVHLTASTCLQLREPSQPPGPRLRVQVHATVPLQFYELSSPGQPAGAAISLQLREPVSLDPHICVAMLLALCEPSVTNAVSPPCLHCHAVEEKEVAPGATTRRST